MRRILTGALAALVALAVASPALAQSSTVIEQLEVRGYYIAANADADFEDLERVVSETSGVYFVVLASDPNQGTDLYATDALEALGVEGTVVVVSPGEVGARSTIHGDAAIDDALDALLDGLDRGYYEGFRAFADALAPVAAPATTAAGDAPATTVASAADPVASSGGGGGGFIFLLIILGVGALIWFGIRRSKKNREEMLDDRIDEIKAEIQGQLSEAANDILELEDDILLSDNDKAKELYYAGSAAYSEFQEKLAAARSFAELDELAEGADVALWQLESAEALLEGNDPPPKPDARPGYEPPAPTPAPNVERRRPDLPEDLQIRRERRQQRGSRPRRRSSGGLGGLGAAAVILKSLQQGRAPRSDGTRTTRASRSSRATGVNVPTLGGGSRRSTPPSSSAPRSGSKPRAKGRGRKKRR